ncbi:transcriptional regulator [Halobacteriales archaeon QS_7_68_65]|nr:MAG: transcriptional regulator [Halobacteriales archaeon QS_7_68_65]
MARQHSCECCSTDPATVSPGTTAEAATTCYCPLDGVIDAISKKYAMQIVGLLGTAGPTRYGEIRERVAAASTSTLSNRLDALVDADLIERRSFDEVPPHVEYSLTPRGRELEERLQPLLEWATMDG